MVLAASEQRRKRFNPTVIPALLAVILTLLVGGLSGSAAAGDRSADNADANAASNDGNSPAVGKIDITISKETTFVKGPVRADGTINYVAALRKRRGKMPKPEDNVAAGLIEILGLDVIPRDHRKEVFRKLGIDPDPNDQYMVDLFEFIDPNGQYDNPVVDQAWQQYDASIGSPWNAEDHPLIAAWMKRCTAHLDDACRIAERKEYRMPVLSSKKSGVPGSPIGVLNSHRNLVRALCCRAMLRLGSGDLKRSLGDLEAAHLLARKRSRDMLVVDGLIRLAMDSLAANAGKGYLASDRVEAGDLRLYRKMLRELPEPVDLHSTMEIERLIALGVAMSVIRDARDDRKIGSEELVPKLSLGKGPVEWDAALRRLNTPFDLLERLGKLPAWKRTEVRRELHELIDTSYKRVEKENLFRAGFSELLNHDKWARFRGERLGDVIVCAVLPPRMDRLFDMESEYVALLQVVRLASAVRQYQLGEGDLPEKLSALVKAKLIEQVPTDPFSGKPLVYKRTDEGFVLYSVGLNLRDDGGKENRDLKEDDIVVRYPQPKADAGEDSEG